MINLIGKSVNIYDTYIFSITKSILKYSFIQYVCGGLHAGASVCYHSCVVMMMYSGIQALL
jgi:accessory gene regulator protein AgrB